MKLKRLLSACCLLFISIESTALVNVKQQALQKILTELRSVSGVAGYSMAVVKQGTPVVNLTSGYIDKNLSVPAKPSHLFRLASVSKVIGATLIADLIQQGKLTADDRVRKWLPELPAKYKEITVRQLVNHTSGLPHYQPIDLCCWTKQYNSAIDSLEVLKNRDLLFSPGTDYHYSSFAYTVLGALYERVEQRLLNQGIQDFIDKLTKKPEPKVENITTRNSRRSNLFEQTDEKPESVKFDNKSYTVLGGGMSSSALNLAMFGDAVLHHEYFAEQTRSLLFKVPNDFQTTDNALYEMGFGWRVGKDFSGNLVYHHSGATLGARSFLVLYPELGISLAFLSNTSWTAQMETNAFAIIDLLFNSELSEIPNKTFSFKGKFNQLDIQAKLKCNGKQCLFVESTTAFSDWLNRFNHAKDRRNPSTHSSWLAHKTTNGLVLITSIGLVFLERKQGQWIGKIGSNREITLSLEDTCPIPLHKRITL